MGLYLAFTHALTLQANAPNIEKLSLQYIDRVMKEVFVCLQEEDSLGKLPFPKLTTLKAEVTNWTACNEHQYHEDFEESLLRSFKDMVDSRWMKSLEGEVAKLTLLKASRRLVKSCDKEWFLERLVQDQESSGEGEGEGKGGLVLDD